VESYFFEKGFDGEEIQKDFDFGCDFFLLIYYALDSH